MSRRTTPQLILSLVTVMVIALASNGAEKPSRVPKKWVRSNTNPVIVPESLPVASTALYPFVSDASVMFDEGKFKMWHNYGGADNIKDESSGRARVAYQESDDGINWRLVSAPSLDVGESVGTAWDRTNSEIPSVIKDESLPDGHPRRYRMYYAGLDRELENLPFEELVKIGMLYGIGLAFSPDGKQFTRLPAEESPFSLAGLVFVPNPPTLDRDTFDFLSVADPHVIKKDGRYFMWYTSGVREANSGRGLFVIAFAISDDGIHWIKQGPVILPDRSFELRSKIVSIGRPYVIFKDGRFEMFYDAIIDDNNPLQNTAIGIAFAVSLDGKNWTKAPKPIFISNNGQAERSGIIVGCAVLFKDGVYNLYYPAADPDFNRWNINLATAKAKR
ncbi:MAG: hypothetical protein AB1489_11985 [Acidobacteriota bacterium]